jgi:hypothetical protein
MGDIQQLATNRASLFAEKKRYKIYGVCQPLLHNRGVFLRNEKRSRTAVCAIQNSDGSSSAR